MTGSVAGCVSQKRYCNLALGTILRLMLICIVGGRWSQAGGIFAPMKRAATWPAVPTASFLSTGGNPKTILSEYLVAPSSVRFLTSFSEEHYRRSSDCSFFVFAQHPSKKTKSSRSKKPKSSKASSRLSTLSTASEAPTDDFDDQMDQSIMSDTSTKPKNTKKSAKSRSRASKSKKADTEGTGEPMDMDDTEDASPEPPKPKRATRGKKRTSDQAGQGDFDGTDIEATEAPAPAPKKRATRTRGSASRQNSVDIDDVTSIASHDEAASLEGEPKKGRRTTKKASSTRGRKASGASSTKAPSKSRVPDDEELDAALEADLEQDVHDYEEQPAEKSTKQASKKPKSNKKSKTETKALVDTTDVPTGHAERPEDRAEEVPETDEVESVGTGSRAQALPEEREDTEAAVPGRHESVASAGIATNDSGQRSEAEPIDEVKTKKSKKTSADKTKKLKKTSKQPEKVSGPKGDPIEDVEDAPEEEPAEADIDMPDQKEALEPSVAKEEEQVEDRSSRRRSSNHPPKTIERYSDMPHEQQFAKSLTESQGSGAHDESNNTRHTDRQADGAISPIPSAPKSTPSLSPQSSDAENQPPSTKASATRDHTPLPSKQPSVGAPLAANTPSPSKRNVNAGGLKSSQPWTPIDIEAILFGAGSEKENSGRPIGELSSAEKQMTVEEWIQWQAKNGEERLRQECERLVSHFEKEGGRAMRVLESIECID